MEGDKETQSNKLMKTTKLSLTFDKKIFIHASPHYTLNTEGIKDGLSKFSVIKDSTDQEILEDLKA